MTTSQLPSPLGRTCLACPHSAGEKRKERTTPFGVNLMRSQVLYRAAHILQVTLPSLYGHRLSLSVINARCNVHMCNVRHEKSVNTSIRRSYAPKGHWLDDAADCACVSTLLRGVYTRRAVLCAMLQKLNRQSAGDRCEDDAFCHLACRHM